VAYKFIRSMKVKGHLKCPKSQEYHDFIDAVYEVARGDRAQSVFSDVHPVDTPTFSQCSVIVEVPMSSAKKGEQASPGSVIKWRPIMDTPRRSRHVAVAVPEIAYTVGSEEEVNEQEESDNGPEDTLQSMLDAQLQPPTTPFRQSLSPTSKFFQQFRQEIEEAALPTPPPLPPVHYKSPTEPTNLLNSDSSNQTIIVDLCDFDEDIEMSEPNSSPPSAAQARVSRKRATPDDDEDLSVIDQVDLTQDPINAAHNNDEEDFQIIASATRAQTLPPGARSSTLSIRSRSLSHSTTPKSVRGGGRLLYSPRGARARGRGGRGRGGARGN
jgi:hypothetical protein